MLARTMRPIGTPKPMPTLPDELRPRGSAEEVALAGIVVDGGWEFVEVALMDAVVVDGLEVGEVMWVIAAREDEQY